MQPTLRKLFFAGTNFFAVRSLEIFCGNFNFADFSLERKLERFFELFDLSFSHLKNIAGT